MHIWHKRIPFQAVTALPAGEVRRLGSHIVANIAIPFYIREAGGQRIICKC